MHAALQRVLAVSLKEWGMDTPEGHCSHGKTWKDYCPACALVSAREVVQHWGSAVDDARKVIAEAVAGAPDSEGGEV
ncbi:hypothetical protein [Burkholderia cepacia]|uniref:hypothetical protein n=1 Tax=Burkholderia cepacia TaxID=292 RepID=UPI0012D8D08F|nr:hypothetical protein [Burkholderia cepacia]